MLHLITLLFLLIQPVKATMLKYDNCSANISTYCDIILSSTSYRLQKSTPSDVTDGYMSKRQNEIKVFFDAIISTNTIDMVSYILGSTPTIIIGDILIDGSTYTVDNIEVAVSTFLIPGTTYYVGGSTYIIGEYDETKGGWLTYVAGLIVVLIGSVLVFLRKK